MPQLRHSWVARSYEEYVDAWLLDKWGYARGWLRRFPEMILWYATAGSAVLNERIADSFLARVRAGDTRGLPLTRRATLREAQKLAAEICLVNKASPVSWFTGECGALIDAWRQLDDIPNVGSKVASFLMRDLSFLRDRCLQNRGLGVRYTRTRHASWFRQLPIEDQALFVPIDIYVHRAARGSGASRVTRRYGAIEIQADPDLHRRAATEIVQWARKRDLDPRDVDEYWYSLGAGNIDRNGTALY